MTSTIMTEGDANWGETREQARARRRIATKGRIVGLALLMLPLVPFAAGVYDGLLDRPKHEPAWTTPVSYAAALVVIVAGLSYLWRHYDEWERRRVVNALAVAGATVLLLYPTLRVIAQLGAPEASGEILWRVPLFAMAVAVVTQHWRAGCS